MATEPVVTEKGAGTGEPISVLLGWDQLLLVLDPPPLFFDFLAARFSLMDLSDFLLAVCRGDLSDTALAPWSRLSIFQPDVAAGHEDAEARR